MGLTGKEKGGGWGGGWGGRRERMTTHDLMSESREETFHEVCQDHISRDLQPYTEEMMTSSVSVDE